MRGPLPPIFAVALTLAVTAADAAPEPRMHAGSLEVELERLRTTARVLYVAAHPDDENTRLLTYLANHRHLDVAYLSLTRGGGGQNLIGAEQGALLAVLRTQELLAARRTDGARQFFTRARDFGYCKGPEEATATWGEQAVLGDVVWVLRTFRPDVIITRFTEAGPSHGHHTASARLAHAAFDAAGDPSRFPEQLTRGATPWPAHRLLLNVPRWGRSNDDVSGYLALDVGGYDPRLGASYGEIAADSRTNHKSQGFGSAGRRGQIFEYLSPIAGPAPKDDLLDGVELGWKRFDGGEAVDAALAKALGAFDAKAPERAVPGLLEAHAALDRLAADRPIPRVLEARTRVEGAIEAALGVHARATSSRSEVTRGGRLPLEVQVWLRRPADLRIEGLTLPGGEAAPGAKLAVDRTFEVERTLKAPAEAKWSVAPWLSAPIAGGAYAVPAPELVAAPEAPAPLTVHVRFALGAARWTKVLPVAYSRTDRVHGERRHPTVVTPPITVTPLRRTTLLPGGRSVEVAVRARAGEPGAKGEVGLELPEGWKVEPRRVAVSLASIGATETARFTVTPPAADARPVEARPFVEVDGSRYTLRRDVVDYPHVPPQVVLHPATMRLAPVDFQPPKARVGYLAGSGDTVAENLEAVGVNVEQIDAATLAGGDLSRFDVVLVGVRAYNVRGDELAAAHPALMKWVEGGGRMVVQYNTSSSWRPLKAVIGPHKLSISRGRVTDETAVMRALKPDHPVLITPHRLTPADFEGWVQERGLYFAESWGEAFEPVFAVKDPGEKEQQGSLLVSRHGKGAFVYTGLSFFRQLPAGVPGAYRLLANILAFGGQP